MAFLPFLQMEMFFMTTAFKHLTSIIAFSFIVGESWTFQWPWPMPCYLLTARMDERLVRHPQCFEATTVFTHYKTWSESIYICSLLVAWLVQPHWGPFRINRILRIRTSCFTAEPAWRTLELIWGYDADHRAAIKASVDRMFDVACSNVDTSDYYCADLALPDPFIVDSLSAVREMNDNTKPASKRQKTNGKPTITFVTGNKKKLEEVKRILGGDGNGNLAV